MDTSRFKRRETQNTQRRKIHDATGGMVHANVTPGYSSRPRPAAVAPALPHQARPITAPKPFQEITTPVQPLQPPVPIVKSRIREMPVAPQAPAARQPIDMGLPGGESTFQALTQVRQSKWARFKPLLVRTTAFSMVLVLAFGSFMVSQGFFKIRKVFNGGTVSAASLNHNVDPGLLKGEGDGRINILLLGRGGASHTAPDLTDTVMVASIDPVNHTSTLLSIPRDLWVDVPSFNAMKINAVWVTGKNKYLGKSSKDMKNTMANQAGFELIDQVVEGVTGVPIHYNLMVDFTAFKQAVDTVGGVNVNVPEDLIDPTVAWENGNNPTIAKAGPQVFDGKKALIYVRSRYTSSDFARAERQRGVLLALKDKAVTAGTVSNPIKLAGLMNAFTDNAQTDLSIGDASRLLSIVKNISSSNVNSVGLAAAPNSFVTTGNMNGQSIVLPKAGIFNYSTIQTFIRTQLKDGYITKENSKILVLNGSTVPGLATTKSDELKTYGYNIVGSANAPTSGYAETMIIDLSSGKKKYTKNYLEQRYSVTATSTLPDASLQANGADFVIILGSDATISSQN